MPQVPVCKWGNWDSAQAAWLRSLSSPLLLLFPFISSIRFPRPLATWFLPVFLEPGAGLCLRCSGSVHGTGWALGQRRHKPFSGSDQGCFLAARFGSSVASFRSQPRLPSGSFLPSLASCSKSKLSYLVDFLVQVLTHSELSSY